MPSLIRPMTPALRRWGRHSCLPAAVEWRAFLPARGRRTDGTTATRRCVLASALLLLFISTGCTSAPRITIPRWQKAVTQYVKEEGNNRPSILRDVTIKGGRRGFAVLGHPHPDKAQDVVGLLLAHRSVAGRPTFIYLVAQVRSQEVRDLRLATLSELDGQLRWTLSPENDDARKIYLDWRRSRWQSLYPDRDDPPLSYQGFPLDEDTFDVTLADQHITAEHPPSGARWILPIPTTQPASVAFR